MNTQPKALRLAEELLKTDTRSSRWEAADELCRLHELNQEWERKAATWLASPEAAQRLDGYRELAQRVNQLEMLKQEPVAWVDLLKQAEDVVRSKSLWKKYIDDTPLANDIAVWMASFAQEHATPPAQREPLTEGEIEKMWFQQADLPTAGHRIVGFARAIEAADGITKGNI
jgi:hypothetical protein